MFFSVQSFGAGGRGDDSCGKFTNAVREVRNGNWTEWNGYADYAYGFVSATNYWMPEIYNAFGSTDMLGMMGFLEKYCADNPLDTYFSALSESVVELYPNSTKTKP